MFGFDWEGLAVEEAGYEDMGDWVFYQEYSASQFAPQTEVTSPTGLHNVVGW